MSPRSNSLRGRYSSEGEKHFFPETSRHTRRSFVIIKKGENVISTLDSRLSNVLMMTKRTTQNEEKRGNIKTWHSKIQDEVP